MAWYKDGRTKNPNYHTDFCRRQRQKWRLFGRCPKCGVMHEEQTKMCEKCKARARSDFKKHYDKMKANKENKNGNP